MVTLPGATGAIPPRLLVLVAISVSANGNAKSAIEAATQELQSGLGPGDTLADRTVRRPSRRP
jgi:hypothetical protein